MKKLLTTLLLMGFIVNIYAQYAQKRNELMYKRAVQDIRFNKAGETVIYLMNEVEGTPYLKEEFSKSKVFLNNGDILDSVVLNYNIFTDAFEFMKNDVPYILTNSYILNKIEYNGKEFYYTKYLDLNGQFKHGYAEGLIMGKCNLYKKYQIAFNEPVPAETQFNEPKPARFSEMDPYYFVYFEDKEKTVRINTVNKKKFSEFFYEKKDEVYNYIKENKLSLNEENDLKDIISYYNTL